MFPPHPKLNQKVKGKLLQFPQLALRLKQPMVLDNWIVFEQDT